MATLSRWSFSVDIDHDNAASPPRLPGADIHVRLTVINKIALLLETPDLQESTETPQYDGMLRTRGTLLVPFPQFLDDTLGSFRRITSDPAVSLQPQHFAHVAQCARRLSIATVAKTPQRRVVPIRVTILGEATVTPAEMEMLRLRYPAAWLEPEREAARRGVPASKPCSESPACSICFDEFGGDNDNKGGGCSIVRTPCSHVYHEHCIARWLETDRTCPLCRANTSSYVYIK